MIVEMIGKVNQYFSNTKKKVIAPTKGAMTPNYEHIQKQAQSKWAINQNETKNQLSLLALLPKSVRELF